MGFFSRLFKENTATKFTLLAPVNGKLVPASQIPDATFSEGILGPTIGIEPSADGTVYSPCDGTISQIFKTGHAVTITSTNNVEILIHVGINTVDLQGEGFQALVKDDQQVKAGDPLIKFDSNVIKGKGLSNVVPVVICNSQDFASVEFVEQNQDVTHSSVICTIVPNKE